MSERDRSGQSLLVDGREEEEEEEEGEGAVGWRAHDGNGMGAVNAAAAAAVTAGGGIQ